MTETGGLVQLESVMKLNSILDNDDQVIEHVDSSILVDEQIILKYLERSKCFSFMEQFQREKIGDILTEQAFIRDYSFKCNQPSPSGMDQYLILTVSPMLQRGPESVNGLMGKYTTVYTYQLCLSPTTNSGCYYGNTIRQITNLKELEDYVKHYNLM